MSESNLNLYGDRLVSTTGVYGADIAAQRIDELDKEALIQALSLQNTRGACVDLGCGPGCQGTRFAMLGAAAYLYDLLPESSMVRYLRENTSLCLSYRQGDLKLLEDRDLPDRIQLAFSQRFIHYLKYGEAQLLIRAIAERMQPETFFYISASGLNSELGRDYPGLTTELIRRFSCLSSSMQAKHAIREPVCLYTESDLTELMGANKLRKCQVWTSRFGSVKGVFQKSS